MQPILMLLSQNQETSSPFFCGYLKSRLNFENLQKKDDFHRSDISEIRNSEKYG